ncbi:hypothetical protein SAMN06269301_0776 [Geobacter sp. DSM 9736]|nr:hypothetical protein SAMN06269301_0776 [Geobacter sp. DSM 9736]
MFASDHINLREPPTDLEDAYSIKFTNREFQGVLRDIEDGKGASRWLYQPIFELGLIGKGPGVPTGNPSTRQVSQLPICGIQNNPLLLV